MAYQSALPDEFNIRILQDAGSRPDGPNLQQIEKHIKLLVRNLAESYVRLDEATYSHDYIKYRAERAVWLVHWPVSEFPRQEPPMYAEQKNEPKPKESKPHAPKQYLTVGDEGGPGPGVGRHVPEAAVLQRQNELARKRAAPAPSVAYSASVSVYSPSLKTPINYIRRIDIQNQVQHPKQIHIQHPSQTGFQLPNGTQGQAMEHTSFEQHHGYFESSIRAHGANNTDEQMSPESQLMWKNMNGLPGTRRLPTSKATIGFHSTNATTASTASLKRKVSSPDLNEGVRQIKSMRDDNSFLPPMLADAVEKTTQMMFRNYVLLESPSPLSHKSTAPTPLDIIRRPRNEFTPPTSTELQQQSFNTAVQPPTTSTSTRQASQQNLRIAAPPVARVCFTTGGLPYVEWHLGVIINFTLKDSILGVWLEPGNTGHSVLQTLNMMEKAYEFLGYWKLDAERRVARREMMRGVGVVYEEWKATERLELGGAGGAGGSLEFVDGFVRGL